MDKNPSLIIFGAAAVAGVVVAWRCTRSSFSSGRVTAEVLAQQNASTSEAVIAQMQGDACFAALSAAEEADTAARDKADDEKLQAGVDLAVKKGVLPAGLQPAPYTHINVQGKSTAEICGEIRAELPRGEGQGAVLVLVGLSGTGKGTTVAALAAALPKAVTWSNGNVFRSLTLLAVKWCAQRGLGAFDPHKALTPENLSAFVGMLEFGQFKGEAGPWDIRIRGLGLDVLVSDIANTDLKAPSVGRNIPTVAAVTQGEVVAFVASATARMSAAGMHVIIEGREATVNHIPTPYRFALTLDDTTVIGRRRAAQRLMAGAARVFAAGGVADPSPAEIAAVLKMLARAMAPSS